MNTVRLSHINTVAVHARGKTEDGSWSIIMDHVPSGTLKERIQRKGPLPAPAAIEVTLQISQALAVAHRRGVVIGT
jgi:serine/threonine protein kinase